MRGDCGAGSRCNGTESQLITERFSALCADEDEAWRRDVRSAGPDHHRAVMPCRTIRSVHRTYSPVEVGTNEKQ